MNISNYFWYFQSAIPPRICDMIVQYGKAEKNREIMAITGGYGRDRDLNKQPLSKEEIKEYSILYIMFNYPGIISPRIEIFRDIQFSSESLNQLKSELIKLIFEEKFNDANKSEIMKKYLNLVNDINQNVVIKNIFLKKDQDKQIELLNEILKELNDIKFSKKIENLENKLIEKFDEKSYSDLIKLKSQINKE